MGDSRNTPGRQRQDKIAWSDQEFVEFMGRVLTPQRRLWRF